VVELPAARWWLIRNLFILPFRPYRTARAYRKIWSKEGAPLVSTSRFLAADLEWELGKRSGSKIPVFAAMRYGKPSIAAGLDVLRRRGCQRLLVLPLYPQYSATTTATAFDEVFRAVASWRKVPELRTIADYHDHPAYVGALASSLYAVWKEDGLPARLVISFHGLPQSYVDAGDPYYEQCQVTSALLADRLEFDSKFIHTAYQSRFGRQPWIEPSLKDTLRDIGREKTEGVHVICPGFPVDCLETLEEVAIAGAKLFTKAGGDGFRYIPALNRNPEHVSALAEIAIEHLSGWVV
jgi:ferrochelatase